MRNLRVRNLTIVGPEGFEPSAKRKAVHVQLIYGFENSPALNCRALWNFQNFGGKEDELIYMVNIKGYEWPFTVEIDLLYHSIGYRWSKYLDQNTTGYVNEFRNFYIYKVNVGVVESADQLIVE